MQKILHYFRQGRDYQNVRQALDDGLQEQLIAGLNGSARTIFMSSLFTDTDRTQLIMTYNLHQAQKLYEDFVEWLGEDTVYLYPVNEMRSAELATASPELRSERVNVLNQLIHNDQPLIVIIPLAGMKRLLPPPKVWQDAQLHIYQGQDLNLEELKQAFVRNGYKRVDMVESQGEYSLRGGIIDIFPAGQTDPLRIELFDTEVDSLRLFDLDSQRSKQELQETIIGPSVEWVLEAEHFERAETEVHQRLIEQLEKVKDEEQKQKLKENVQLDLEKLQNKTYFDGLYKYISCFYEQTSTLLDYIPQDAIFLLDEPTRIFESEEQISQEEHYWQMAMLEEGDILPRLPLSVSLRDILDSTSTPVLYLSLFLRQIQHTNPQNIVHFTSKPVQDMHGQFHLLKQEVQRWRKSSQVVLFLAGSEERAARMERVLNDFGIEARRLKQGENLQAGIPVIQVGAVQSGFELPLHSLVVITETELFSNQQKKKGQSKKRSPQDTATNAQKIQSYNELSPGDYVVHINHGIGRYIGIETLEVEGAHKDYLNIEYAKNDKLYVPVDQIEQVQKYVANEEKKPKLYQLGGNEWKRVKNRVKASVQDIAENLIQLYAKREATPGYAFSKDTTMHQEFDSLFPYEETEDQLRSIEEIKQDMEKSRPMDRLLCGDVGYGKTEVAIRAAFKAVMDGKQVALLVPTTILAQQHFETFKERFHDYPVEIELLSRFRSRKEQNEALKKTKSGIVDILIGTHRLLSKDVSFHDLGLLIVDEEQRFGVSHKEKIKQLKANVDVLTLTATPIPRTLHMSMLGVRDLSVIETPPENRFPVQTYVVEYQGALIREAIEREMARNGQVYFLYNEVQGIERKAEEIRALVPDARVGVAHGKMKESELESIMISFLNGEFDVLVSTTIIETGVDIPNVNTLIIHDADKMGLSQLYQLRGRVGRSNRTAYAYFTYQRGKVLTEVAEKRLQAIKEFTELGSGFKIAMRDLAIRGAGNLLGAEQHGYINSVGFDLYSQMLTDAIQELKGERKPEEEVQLEMDVHIDAYIPDTYIEDGRQKIEMYKKVAAVHEQTEVDEIQKELNDRFGTPPQPVQRLLRLSRLKVYAEQLHMDTMVLKNDVLKLLFAPALNDKIDGGKLFELVGRYGRHFGLISDTQIGINVKVKNLSEDEWLEQVEQLLQQIVNEQVLKGDEEDDSQTTENASQQAL